MLSMISCINKHRHHSSHCIPASSHVDMSPAPGLHLWMVSGVYQTVNYSLNVFVMVIQAPGSLPNPKSRFPYELCYCHSSNLCTKSSWHPVSMYLLLTVLQVRGNCRASLCSGQRRPRPNYLCSCDMDTYSGEPSPILPRTLRLATTFHYPPAKQLC